MGILLERLRQRHLLVSDGAWGTMLQAQGLPVGQAPEEWNASHPDAVRAVARAYADVGSHMVLTNTFGGSPAKLAKSGLAGRTAELNAAGARLSREGAPGAIVAASIGPTGEFLEPLGEWSEAQMESGFMEQFGALFDAGITVLCIETMSAIEEACCALRAARRLQPDVELMCTMTFSPTPQGPRTMMGVSPAQAASALVEAGADVVGANCGNGIKQMIPIIEEFRRHTSVPLLVHANAGLPHMVDGRAVYGQTPALMAERVGDLVAAGAAIIGGCCGTTPEHIRAIREAVERLRGTGEPRPAKG